MKQTKDLEDLKKHDIFMTFRPCERVGYRATCRKTSPLSSRPQVTGAFVSKKGKEGVMDRRELLIRLTSAAYAEAVLTLELTRLLEELKAMLKGKHDARI